MAPLWEPLRLRGAGGVSADEWMYEPRRRFGHPQDHRCAFPVIRGLRVYPCQGSSSRPILPPSERRSSQTPYRSQPATFFCPKDWHCGSPVKTGSKGCPLEVGPAPVWTRIPNSMLSLCGVNRGDGSRGFRGMFRNPRPPTSPPSMSPPPPSQSLGGRRCPGPSGQPAFLVHRKPDPSWFRGFRRWQRNPTLGFLLSHRLVALHHMEDDAGLLMDAMPTNIPPKQMQLSRAFGLPKSFLIELQVLWQIKIRKLVYVTISKLFFCRKFINSLWFKQKCSTKILRMVRTPQPCGQTQGTCFRFKSCCNGEAYKGNGFSTRF